MCMCTCNLYGKSKCKCSAGVHKSGHNIVIVSAILSVGKCMRQSKFKCNLSVIVSVSKSVSVSISVPRCVSG
jgi:hypothetical protein